MESVIKILRNYLLLSIAAIALFGIQDAYSTHISQPILTIEDNFVYLHKIESLTDSEKTAAQTEVDNQTASRNREERNKRLVETDWMACSDVTMSNDWKTYRQALRDITKHCNWPNLKVPDIGGSGDNDWPVKPS